MTEKLPYHELPDLFKDLVPAWIEHGNITHAPLFEKIIANDLLGVAVWYHEDHWPAIRKVLHWMQSNAPKGSFGNPLAVTNWPLYLKAKARQESSNGT